MIVLTSGSVTKLDDINDTVDTNDWLPENMNFASYIPDAPVVINNDADFVSQGWPGNGTEEDPYVIAGLSIATDEVCINISNVEVYFEIRNCLLVPPSYSGNNGIYIDNVTHCSVLGCTVLSHEIGIYLESSANSILINNTAGYNIIGILLNRSNDCILIKNTVTFNSRYGFYLDASIGCLLTNNTATSNQDAGFNLHNSTNSTVRNNTAVNNHDDGFVLGNSGFCTLVDNHAVGNGYDAVRVYASSGCRLTNITAIDNGNYGLKIDYSDDCILANNTATDNIGGIVLQYSSGCILINNTMHRNGLFIVGSTISNWLHTILNNTVNGKPIAYFVNVSDMVVDSEQYSQLLLVNSSTVTIRDGVFSHVSCGIQISYCTNCFLINNTAIFNSLVGFLLDLSSGCTLTNNTAMENYEGVGLWASENCTLINNTATSNTLCGFTMLGCSNCTLVNNTAISSGENFLLYYCDYCTLTNNTAASSDAGFYIDDCNICMLTHNTAAENGYGFLLYYSAFCTFFLNEIGPNGIANAVDNNGYSNTWDNGISTGNYWSDYNGTGIYFVSGSSYSVDRYPLVLGQEYLTINSPADILYEEGGTGHQITWNPSSSQPGRYEIYKNGSLIDSDEWDGSSIIVSVDGLAVGTYNYTLMVFDTSDYSKSDTVFVTVADSAIPFIDSPIDIEYEEGSSGHTIVWSPTDLHPDRYELYRDGLLIDSKDWDGSLISIAIDGLLLGVYNYTIIEFDTSDNWVSDQVVVTVIDTELPTISHPIDFEYYENTIGHNIAWSPSDAHPSHYVIYRNGTEMASDNWDGGPIAVSIDGLSVGVYNYTIVVYDTSNNSVSDEVSVTVLEETHTTTTTITTTETTTTTSTTSITEGGEIPIQLLIMVGGGVGLIIVVIVLLRSRRY